MKRNHFASALIALLALVGACGVMAADTSSLEQTRSEFYAAQNNPNVVKYAPLELKQAKEALDQANAAADSTFHKRKVGKLAYIAHQKIALAQETAKQKLAEADVATVAKERDQIRLDQRTKEADKAKIEAQVAQGAAADAQRRAEDAQARAAQLEVQLAELAAKKTERGMVITFGDVLFETNVARLNPEGMRTVQKLADVLMQNPERAVLVEGYTDSIGSVAYNQELSERRAISVRNALQEFGVGRDRVAVRGYGKSFPVASNNSSLNRQLNRRVEIVISDAGGKVISR